MVVLRPPIVTITCIGKAPSGTAEATNVRVSGLNLNQPGSGCPLVVDTLIAELLPAVFATCAGRGKLKPLPAVAMSLGTETETIPDSSTDVGRIKETEMPLLPVAPAVPVVPLLIPLLEVESVAAEV